MTKISYFSQDVFLTNDNLLNNIIYPHIDINTFDISHIQLLLEDLTIPYELSHMIKEDGDNLSGGEKKRIAFLRSISKNSDIMLLDEVTSGLDSKNEQIILDMIKSLKGKKTIFLISHSNSSFMFDIADKIIEMPQ